MSRAALRTYSAPASERAHSALACSRPTRSISASALTANPGSTTPVLRPEALQATLCASSTTTDQPSRATSRATVRPARPAPMTQTSTSSSTVSRAAGRAFHPGRGIPVRPVGLRFGGQHCASIIRRSPGRLQLRHHDLRLLATIRGEEKSGESMRRLLLLRHAKAERLQPGGRDHDRVLAERGRADAHKLGVYLARHGFIPDRALVSTSARTRETWALLATSFGKAPPVSFEDRLYEATPQAILQVDQGDRPGDRHVAGDRPQPRPAGAGGDAGRLGRHRRARAPRRGFPDLGAGRDQLRRRKTGAAFIPMAAGWSISSRRTGSRRRRTRFSAGRSDGMASGR